MSDPCLKSLSFLRRHVWPPLPWWAGERHWPRHDADHRKPALFPQPVAGAVAWLAGDGIAFPAHQGESGKRNLLGTSEKKCLQVILKKSFYREVNTDWGEIIQFSFFRERLSVSCSKTVQFWCSTLKLKFLIWKLKWHFILAIIKGESEV